MELFSIAIRYVCFTLAFEDKGVGRDKCSFTNLLLLTTIRDHVT